MVVDYVRNVLRVEDADHEETSPGGGHLAVTALSCSLVGQRQAIRLVPGSEAARIYGGSRAEESFYCSFGVNPAYRDPLEAAGFRVSGVDDDGEVRMMELTGHPFFVGTLFVPQARPPAEGPHPLLTAFSERAQARTGERPA